MDEYEPWPGVPRSEQIRRLHVRWALQKRGIGRAKTEMGYFISKKGLIETEPLEDNEEIKLPCKGSTKTAPVAKIPENPNCPRYEDPRLEAIRAFRAAVYSRRVEQEEELFQEPRGR